MSPSRTLTVNVAGDARGFTRELAQVDKATRRTEGNFHRLGKSGSGVLGKGLRDVGHGAAYALGAGGFGGGMYALFDITKKTISQFRESQTVTRQTNAVLKSTGDASNVTAKHVADLANAIKRKSGIDDETIATGENMLLTFTKIRNESGKGNKLFDQATQSITDMAVAMNKGATPSSEQLRQTAIQVGKALQDPIKGSTALRRVGVALTKQQIEQIKTLEAHGKHLQAQKIILRELTTEFGGSAAKQKTAAKSLNTSLGDLGEKIGGAIAPAMDRAAKKASIFVQQMVDGRGAGGRFADKMKDVWGALRDVFGVVKDVATWLGRHPALLKAAAGAWVAYKTAALTQLGLVKAAELGLFGPAMRRRMAAGAGASGKVAGRAFGLAVVAASAIVVAELGPQVVKKLKGYLDNVHIGVKLTPFPHIDVSAGPYANLPKGAFPTGAPFKPNPNRQPIGDVLGVPRLGPVSPKFLPKVPKKIRASSASTGSVDVMARASGEAGGQELGSLKRAQAWVQANYPGVGTLLEDAGGGNQHLHIEAAKGTVVQIGKALQRAGFSVGENPAFGGVHNVHSHGGLAGIPGDHYTGNAIDVNADNRSLGVPTGKGGGSSTSTTQPKWRECVMTWYDPALGGINTGGGKKDPFHPTASGEAYNPGAYTCAAPQSYAFGTIIVFAYGGRAVACKVNDRGGAITGHHFDLSRAAAASLGIMGAGKANGLFMLPGKSKSIKKAKTPYDKLQNQLGYLGLEIDAGTVGEAQGLQQQITAINRALPSLTGSNRLRALGDRRTAQQQLKTLAPPKPVKQRVDTSINSPWLQTWIQHQQDLMDAGLLDPITGRDNIANVLDQFAKGKGVSEHDRLSAIAQAQDLRFQNLYAIHPELENPPTALEALSGQLSDIGLQARAGDLTDAQARSAQIAAIQAALPGLQGHDLLEARADLGDLLKEQTASTENLIDALNAVKQSLDEQTNFGKSVAATEAGAMARWVTSVVSRVQGYDVSGRGLTPAYGVARRS